MKVSVNDNEVEVGEDTTVEDLLESFGFPDQGVAVAVDAVLRPRSEWGERVPAGAQVEVVTAVQGG